MEYLDLNDVYDQYINRVITRNKLEGIIYKYYLFNQEKTCLGHWEKDKYEDFISWFYPRLRESIDKYINIGYSFETFLNKVFLTASKEYKIRTLDKGLTEYSTWCARVPDLYVYEEPPEYHFENKKKVITSLICDKKARRNSKRILALLVKCYNYISDDFIDKIAPMIKIDKKELKYMMDNIRRIRQKKDDKIYYLKERAFCQFYRCMVYEKKLSLMNENTVNHGKMKHKLVGARKRLEALRGQLSLVRTDATNSEVAKAIGIQKGTVDASLFRLKEKFNLN